jgi:ATP-dependent 26S proteasome regulatory subunit
MFEGAGDAFSQAYLQSKQLKAQTQMEQARMAQAEKFNAQDMALKIQEQKNDLTLKKQELKLKKQLAKSEEEVNKLEQVGKGIDTLVKSLDYAGTVIQNNPNMTDPEEYKSRMEPMFKILSGSAVTKDAAKYLSMEEAQKAAQSKRIPVVSAQQALAEGSIAHGTEVIKEAREPAEKPVTKADLALAKDIFPRQGIPFFGPKPGVKALEAKAREQLAAKGGADTTKKGKTLVSKQYNAAQNKTRFQYSDGTVEIVEGKQ